MPELPDVETYRRYLDATALHSVISGVDLRAKRLLEGISAARFGRALRGKSLRSTRRHGKYLFADLGDGWLLMHFGMTGRLAYFKRAGDDPEHDRLLLTFADGWHLAYVAPRKLGRLGIVDSPEAFVENEGLGPDALEVGLDEFRRILGGTRSMIKSALMDQGRIAGIGNVYSDEILFRARLHPRARSDGLGADRTRRLHRAVRAVLETAIDRKADPGAMPPSFLLNHREEGGRCPRCGGTVKRISVSGRSGWYCPRCQR